MRERTYRQVYVEDAPRRPQEVACRMPTRCPECGAALAPMAGEAAKGFEGTVVVTCPNGHVVCPGPEVTR